MYVHGFGTFVYQSYPEYEKQGANLTVEIIVRVVHKAMKMKTMSALRNLYIHLDNYSINKNFTVVSVMGALTVLGICRKVKVSYGERGHGHGDNDANMGNTRRVV